MRFSKIEPMINDDCINNSDDSVYQKTNLSSYPQEDVLIGPKEAEELLMLNTRNRPISMSHVNWLAKMMKDGLWVLNAETIKISSSGILIDGQQRLKAVILSKKTVPMTIVRGLPDSVFNTIDLGRVRSVSDALALVGEKYYARLAGAAKLVWDYENDENFSKSYLRMPPTIVGDFIIRHNMLKDSLIFFSKGNRPIITVATIGLHYLFRCVNVALADEFYGRFLDGARLPERNPILALRDRMIANSVSKAKLPRRDVNALHIKAWNAFRTGKRISFVRWARDSGEGFPSISGLDRELFISGKQRPKF